MDSRPPDPLERLVEAVLASSKYKRFCPDLIRRVGEKELSKRRRLKEAIKSTKNKLHQVAGAYQGPKPLYHVWLEQLQRAYWEGTREDFLATCRWIMGHHASTRERLPILDQFYAVVLGDLGPLHSILDVACGLNPLALPWMPLAPEGEYFAYDIDRDLVGFVGSFLELVGVRGHAVAEDVISYGPLHPVDLALVLKALPGLEQVEPGSGMRLLQELPARYLLVSFPVHSLRGQDKGMAAHYEACFRRWMDSLEGTLRRWEFATELAFLLTK